MSRRIVDFLIIASTLFLFLSPANAQAPSSRVSVVLSKNAPELERFAATELCGYLEKLFGVNTEPAISPIANSTAVFLVGSPSTNPWIKSFPKVSDQGIVIRNATGSKSTLIVGGGSPKATLWAVYELAERWGVRYLLDRDALPAKARFDIPQLNIVMEPIFKVRAHPT